MLTVYRMTNPRAYAPIRTLHIPVPATPDQIDEIIGSLWLDLARSQMSNVH